MTPLLQIIRAHEEEFEEKFLLDMCEECGNFKAGNTTNKSIKSHFRSLLIALITAEVEVMKGMKENMCLFRDSFNEMTVVGYNQALSYLITEREELLLELKK